jgi:hypothetical protein
MTAPVALAGRTCHHTTWPITQAVSQLVKWSDCMSKRGKKHKSAGVRPTDNHQGLRQLDKPASHYMTVPPGAMPRPPPAPTQIPHTYNNTQCSMVCACMYMPLAQLHSRCSRKCQQSFSAVGGAPLPRQRNRPQLFQPLPDAACCHWLPLLPEPKELLPPPPEYPPWPYGP